MFSFATYAATRAYEEVNIKKENDEETTNRMCEGFLACERKDEHAWEHAKEWKISSQQPIPSILPEAKVVNWKQVARRKKFSPLYLRFPLSNFVFGPAYIPNTIYIGTW